MTINELIKELKEIAKEDDEENAHEAADAALLKYIDNKQVIKIFEGMGKWYA